MMVRTSNVACCSPCLSATPAQRRKAIADRKRFHAALALEEKRVAKAKPAAVRTAERAVERAGKASSAAYQAVLAYEPPNRADALAFLKFLARERNFCGEESMALCLQGVLKGLRR